jgi:hypothetical protein
VGSSKVTGPPQAFHYKLRNPLTILGYFIGAAVAP